MEPLSRPVPVGSWGDRLRGWVVWFGVGRLVAASVSTVLVVAGGAWLLHNPTPSTEASLPLATTTTAVAGSPPDASAAGGGTEAPPGGIGTRGAGSATTVPTSIVVHVAGAVVAPGVYRLGTDARIQEALAAAGGPVADADWNALNLAAPLTDGTRVYVPRVGEELAGALVTGGSPAAGGSGGSDGEVASNLPIDINRASATELETLPGIGPATAAAIVDERERNGPFASADDLERVRGIGPAKVDALRDLVAT